VKFYDIQECINALTEGSATFVVDSSFFLYCSELISASWVLVNSSYCILASGDFLSTVAIVFCYSATAKSYGVLVIYFTLDKILQIIQSLPITLLIRIGIDCQAVIDSLWIENPIIPFSTPLYLIWRKINLIRLKWNIQTVPFKIKAHQDNQMAMDKLIPFQKLNCLCDS